MVVTRCCNMVVIFGFLASMAYASDLRISAMDARMADKARSVVMGETIVIGDFSLTDHHHEDNLVLKRYQVWSDTAVIRVNSGTSREYTLPTPRTAYFSGHIDGIPGSKAMLSIAENGSINGMVNIGGRYFKLGKAATAKRGFLSGFELDDDMSRAAQKKHACDSEMLPAPGQLKEHKPRKQAKRAPKAAAGTGATYAATIAIETDYELYQRLGSTQAVSQYVADVIAFTSTIYTDELDTALVVGEVSIWDNPADPWEQNSSFCSLLELGKYWNDNKTSVERTLVHYMSGKNIGGGIAWVDVLCYGSFNYNGSQCGLPEADAFGGDYGFTGGMSGTFDIDNPAVIWDVVAVAHEIGHNFGSPHSHCYGGIGGNDEPVDECYSGQSGCYSGATSLPCEEGPGHGCGTLMSYCHLLQGSYGNITMTFGKNHAHGVEPERIRTKMSTHVVDSAVQNPSCLAPAQSCAVPGIAAHPTDKEVCEGGTAGFTVSATGDGLSYDWQLDGVSLGAADSATLLLADISDANTGNITCVVSNECGSVTTDAAVLSLKEATTISVQPVAVEVCATGEAAFSVTASGSGTLTYDWRRNGESLGAVSSNQLNLENISSLDLGNYSVVVTGACGSVTSTAVALTLVESVAITGQPASVTTCSGTTTTFEVTATGESLTYQWKKNGGSIAGATNASYTVDNIQAGNAGNYTVVVTGSCGSETSASATLTVTPGFTITNQPESAVTCAGEDVVFSVGATGSGLSYQWYFGDTAIPGATGTGYTVSGANAGNQGDYKCLVTAACGGGFSSSAALTVKDVPAIQVQPGSKATCIGSSAQFSVTASGDGPLFFQWQKNGENMVGQTGASLVIGVEDESAAGSYHCVISNVCGSVQTNTALLTIDGQLEVDIIASSNAQGLTPITLEALISCFDDETEWYWTNSNTDQEFGHNQNPVELSLLRETTEIALTVGEVDSRGGITKVVRILVPDDPTFQDANGDGCNTIEDLHLQAGKWSTFTSGDANGDGVINITDLLYVSVNMVDPCGAAKVGPR